MTGMKPAFALLCCLVLLLLPGCSLFSEQIDPEGQDDLVGHWVHSYEEDAQGEEVQVFRPVTFKTFPPSRFRMQYVFRENGTCAWYYLAPDDGHHFREGTWRRDARDRDVLHVRQGDQTVSYRILSLSGDLLRLKAGGG